MSSKGTQLCNIRIKHEEVNEMPEIGIQKNYHKLTQKTDKYRRQRNLYVTQKKNFAKR